MPTPSRTARLAVATLLPPLLLVGCDAPGSGGTESGLVARAGDYALTVDEAAGFLEGQDRLPASEEVVRAVADMWIDYTLLAEAVRRDPSLESLDLSAILDEQLERELVLEFRDSVVDPDTTFTEEELREAYEGRSRQARIEARHILLSLPEGATEAQRDSVEELARSLRQRARAGEDFGELARQYSDDAGSASRGGDLGTFGRGEMVPAVEEAAFALDAGEISEPVETPYGLHLIQVRSRQAPDFETNRDRFAAQLRERRVTEAESAYVAGLEEPADVRVRSDAYEVARQIAARPGTELSPRARRRTLVRYDGGALTAGELQTFLQGLPLQQRIQLQQTSRAQLDGILRNLTRRELIVAEARNSGFQISEARRDSVHSRLRGRLEQLVGALGLDTVVTQEGEDASDAVDRVVQDLVTRTLSGRQQVVPLGSLAYTLRQEFGAEIFDTGISRAVAHLGSAQDEGAGGSPSSSPGADDSPAGGAPTAPGPPADSTR